jgi:uncharacterized membrane-anchored protein YhcB (DUF1043 family)
MEHAIAIVISFIIGCGICTLIRRKKIKALEEQLQKLENEAKEALKQLKEKV